MQSLARDGYTAAEVESMIRDDSIAPTWGVDLLDLDGAVIGDLSDSVEACTVSRVMYAQVHGAVDLTVDEDLDWPNVRVRPWQAFGAARFYQGVFGLETPESRALGPKRVAGYDLLTWLQRAIGDTYWVAKSVPGTETYYLQAARDLITASGLTGASVNIQSDSDAVEIIDDLVWALNVEAPDSYLRAINDTLAAVAYRGLWADEVGSLRSIPYVPPEQRSSEWLFDTGDLRTDMLGPERSITRDDWRKPTAWRFVRRGLTSLPTEGAGLYTVGDWDGADVVRQVVAFDASSQTSLVAQGDQRVRTDTSKTLVIEASCDPLPCLAHFDIVTFRDAALDVDVRAQVRQWRQDLAAAKVDLTLEVVA